MHETGGTALTALIMQPQAATNRDAGGDVLLYLTVEIHNERFLC
jgi:hypothetical protein